MPTASEEKEFSAKVPAEEYEKFKTAFPQYGAVTWFINEALSSFNKQVDANPKFRILVEISITQMLDENRNTVLSA